MNIFSRQLSLASYTVIFLLLQAALILLLLYGNQKVNRGYYDQLSKHLENDYKSSISHYRELSDTFFQMTVKAESTFSLFEQAVNASPNVQDTLRRSLYAKIKPIFLNFKNIFRQVHFHLADGTSFLRVHKPHRHGDMLSHRKSVQLMTKEKEFMEGFELGGHFYAIRYLYPLVNGSNTYIGSVELGVSFYQFRKYLNKLSPGEYLLQVKSEVAEDTLLITGKRNFQVSPLSDAFIVENVDDGLNTSSTEQQLISPAVLQRINKKIKPKAVQPLQENKAFSLITRVENQSYMVSFLPLQNIISEDIGYLVKYEKDSISVFIKLGFILAYCIGTVLILALLMLYRWSTNKIFNQLILQQNLIDSIPTPIFYTNAEGHCIGSNASFNDTLTQDNSEKALAPSPGTILPEGLTESDFSDGADVSENEIVLPGSDGEKRYFYCYKTRYNNPITQSTGLVAAMFDISSRKHYEDELKKSHEEVQQIFNTAANGMRVVDRKMNVLRVNDRFVEMSGRSSAEMVNQKCYDIFGGESCMKDICPLKRILSGEVRVQSETVKTFPDGREIPCIVTATPFRDSAGQVVGIVEDFHDISERKAFEEQLALLSYTDELTGLLNRRGFIERAEWMLILARRQKKSLFLVFSDLDNMKDINDTFGHKRGDQALVNIAELLKSTYRETDIIARMGGDEFALLLFDATNETPPQITRRFDENIKSWNENSLEPYELALSMGVVLHEPSLRENIEDLLHRADLAMYEVKKARKEQQD